MKKPKNFYGLPLVFLIIIFIISISGCKQGAVVDNQSVTIDEEFSSLFYSDSGGISGADGIFSVPLPDGSSVFFLGDCFLGIVKNGTRDFNTKMLRNAFNVINKEQTKAKAIFRGEYDDPETLMIPENEPGDSTYRWYWPGHGFVRKDTLYVFALNLYNDPTAMIKIDKDSDEVDEIDELTEGMFAFRISHIDLQSYTLPDFKLIETHKAPFNYKINAIDLGNCVMVDGKWIYIFGTENKPKMSKVHVARTSFESPNFYENWEYSTGDGWDKDINKSKPIDVDISVSEQFSIFKYKDKYVLLTMERTASFNIYTYTSDFPNKGFGNKTFIYHAPDHDLDSARHIFPYNALAHHQYLENDMLLVSYCVNSADVRDVFYDVNNYRARFLRVPMNLILEEKEQE